jgi:hypothetical protein
MLLGGLPASALPGLAARAPGWALGMWSTRHGIKVSFEGRDVCDIPVIFVCFGC